jgi:SOS-response transcriptional repressor LexA
MVPDVDEQDDGLTPTQRAVRDYVVEQIERTQHWPTRAEIAEAMGWSSPNAAQQVLEALERKGWIGRRGPRRLPVLVRHSVRVEAAT